MFIYYYFFLMIMVLLRFCWKWRVIRMMEGGERKKICNKKQDRGRFFLPEGSVAPARHWPIFTAELACRKLRGWEGRPGLGGLARQCRGCPWTMGRSVRRGTLLHVSGHTTPAGHLSNIKVSKIAQTLYFLYFLFSYLNSLDIVLF